MKNNNIRYFKGLFSKYLSPRLDRDIYLIIFIWKMIYKDNKTEFFYEDFLENVIKYSPHMIYRYLKSDSIFEGFQLTYALKVFDLLKNTCVSLHDILETYNNLYETGNTSHYTSLNIIELMIKYANTKDNETIADYFGGSGKILENISNYKELYYNDIYYLENLVAKINLCNKNNVNFFQSNFFKFNIPKVDVIITNIPFLSNKENLLILQKIKELCNRAVVLVPFFLICEGYFELDINNHDIEFRHTNVDTKILTYGFN